MPLLETQAVSRYYRAGTRSEVRALHEVSLAIEPGQFVLLTGPSGSGKTTLLALLGALDRPTHGQVHFEGRNLSGCSDAELARVRRRVGFVFQGFSLLPGLPAWENVTYPLIARGVPRGRRRQRAADLLGELGLAEKIEARPGELSGGEQQRVAVARALAGEPAVLLADEPTSNLDATAGLALLAILASLHRQGMTLVLSSHDPTVLPLATVVCELEAGRLKGVRPAGQSTGSVTA
jgi:putative ABC transport system ATP-binding protein